MVATVAVAAAVEMVVLVYEEAGHAPYPLLSRAESRPGEG